MAVRCGVLGRIKKLNVFMFCAIISSEKSSTSIVGVYGELNRYPLYINPFVRIIKYWGKFYCLILC